MPDKNYLCFEARINTTVKFKINGTLTNTPVIYYSKDDGSTWTQYTFNTNISLSSGEKCYWKGDNNSFSEGASTFIYITGNGQINISGNIMSLLDSTCESLTIPNDYCFYELCYENYFIYTPPELPATTLTVCCYMQMFSNCHNLTKLPELPSLELKNFSYYNMFYGCKKIKLSTTQTEEYWKPYRIPSSGTGIDSSETLKPAMGGMFSETGGTFKSSPAINTTYYLNIDAPSYSVNTDDNCELTEESTPSGHYEEGTNIIAQVTLDDGYDFDGWYENDTKVSSNNPYEFQITKNTTLMGKSKEILEFQINTSIFGKGTSTLPSGIYSKGIHVLDVTPENGWKTKTVKVNDELVSIPYTLNLTKNTTIEIRFEQIIVSVLPDELRSFDYYKNKLPFYLKTSSEYMEHFRIWYDLLVTNQQYCGIANVSDTLLELLNIFDDDYLSRINSLEGSEGGTKSDILDKLAEFFTMSRRFSCTYTQGTEEVTEELTLNNNELLILIKTQIIRNYCDGTYEQLKGIYESAGLHTLLITDQDPAICDLFLAYISGAQEGEDGWYSDNTKKMFLAGLLRISNLGIQYRYGIVDLAQFLIWDSALNAQKFDTGHWGI